VLARRGKPPIAIECKWSADHFDPLALALFGKRYPKATAFVVAHDIDRAYRRKVGELDVELLSLAQLVRRLTRLS